MFKKKTAIRGRFKFCVQTHRILREFTSNSACKREQSHARMNFVERKQDRSTAAIQRANPINSVSLWINLIENQNWPPWPMYRTPLSIVIFVLVAKNSPSLAAISKLRPSVEKPSLSSATTTTSPYLMKPHPRSMKNSCNPCNSCLKKKNSLVFVIFRQCSSVFVLSRQRPFQMSYLCTVNENHW